MFGGLGGINPGQMKAMMSKMGIKQEDIAADRVIIEKEGSRTIIENPNVQKMTMQGQVSWQITGEAREETKAEGIKQEDIDLVAQKTGKSKEIAKEALESAGGDIAEAIMSLS
ncbi:MAG: nascent polypeptide-associated complex protein [archaeon]